MHGDLRLAGRRDQLDGAASADPVRRLRPAGPARHRRPARRRVRTAAAAAARRGFSRGPGAARHRIPVAGQRHHHRLPRRHPVVGAWIAQPDRVARAAGCARCRHLDLRHARPSALGSLQPGRPGNRARRYRGRPRASAGVQRSHAVNTEETQGPGRRRQVQRPGRHENGGVPGDGGRRGGPRRRRPRRSGSDRRRRPCRRAADGQP